MDTVITDNFTIKDRVQDYEYDDSYVLSGHCEKKFVRINDNSVDFENRFLKSINPVHKVSFADRIKLMFNTYLLRKKTALMDYLGSKDLPQKTMKDSMVFSDLFLSLQEDNSFYFTYLGDSLSNGDGYIPHYVSCLEKDCYFEEAYRECVGSRLANLFGVDVVYNTCQDMVLHKHFRMGNVPMVTLNDSKIYDNRYFPIYSVDCIPQGYEFETFNYFTAVDLVGVNSMSRISEKLGYLLEKFSESKKIDISEKCYREIECELLKQVFIKKHIFHDGDLENRNFGFLFNKDTGDVRIAPMHDMEFIFNYAYEDKFKYKKGVFKQDIEFFHKKYPKEFQALMQNMNSAMKSGAIDDLIENTFDNEKYFQIIGKALQVTDYIEMATKMYSAVMASSQDLTPVM